MVIDRKAAKRLKEYFVYHYGRYADSTEWYTNPAPNQWKVYIPELDRKIIFTCKGDGNVIEESFRTCEKLV